MSLLREGLLDGRGVALAGALPDPVRQLLAELGARAETLTLESEPPGDEDQAGAWARSRSPLHALLYDASAAFGTGSAAGLRRAVDGAWIATREVALGALIPDGRGGKVVLVAPRADRGTHAEAARAALENLARTLSVEWARYAITTTALAPGPRTTDSELAELVAFLLSSAGDYFSGCRLELGAVGG